ncbi:hypothetical protein BC940DRAFT_25300 [Gongronella butleri]|nr:hypothetical protein BC940DRAFT_25300 [Gongronella butleri]
MDDLLDLDWSGTSNAAPAPARAPAAAPKANGDKFADLLSYSPSKPAPALSLHQQRLQQQQQQQPWAAASTASSPSPSMRASPAPAAIPRPRTASPLVSSRQTEPEQPKKTLDDLLDPFAKPITTSSSNLSMNALRTQASNPAPSNGQDPWDLDFLAASSTSPAAKNASISPQAPDPFDVDTLLGAQQNIPANTTPSTADDDNPLGILAQPVPQHPEPTDQEVPSLSYRDDDDDDNNEMQAQQDHDQLLAQLVEMGFGADESRVALEASGHRDLQSAIDLIVQNTEAMRRQSEARTKSGPRRAVDSDDEAEDDDYIARTPMEKRGRGARQGPRPDSHNNSSSSTSSGLGGNDSTFQEHKERLVSQASVLGGYLYKNASFLVKTGKEKINKAMDEWQDGQHQTPRAQQKQKQQQQHPNRPRWMTDAPEDVDDAHDAPSSMAKFKDSDDDDDEQEAMAMNTSARPSPAPSAPPAPKPMQQKQKSSPMASARRQRFLFDDDDNDDLQYVSPSRRSPAKGRSPRASPSPSASQMPVSASQMPVSARQQPVSNPSPPRQAPPRPQPKPQVEAPMHVLQLATQHRERGNDQYKLGQYDTAEQAYTSAIEQLPAGHFHLVLLYNNRAMVALKTGHYKQTVQDCDAAFELANQIALHGARVQCQGGVEVVARDHTIKALSRKAEALEHMEKYEQALAAYEQLANVENAQNPKTNQALARCRRIVQGGTPAAAAAPFAAASRPASAKPKPRAAQAPPNPDKSEAIQAMRAQAAQQEADDAERLAKTDAVNARLITWKTGKETNLRALLATLDTLLWEDAHWPSIQMSDLIQPKRCKINYLKAIGKVHPDKLPSTVTVEQRMIASGVFSTLNEAWDAFRVENNL